MDGPEAWLHGEEADFVEGGFDGGFVVGFKSFF